MGKIVIRKRISLDFLGEGYSDAYIVFKSIPGSDYKGIIAKFPKEEKETGESFIIIKGILQDYFIEGEFPVDGKPEKLSKDDIDEFDREALIECFQILMGQKMDPKLEGQSMSQSTTMGQPPTELIRYRYRRIFHLDAYQMEGEPLDQLFTNLYIHSQIQEKQRLEAKHGPG